jgi:hypothetical protein
MTDEVQAAEEAAPEVVQTEAEQVTAPEAAESTEGQVETPPAEDKGEQPEAEEKVSASKARRERRKAELARAKEEAAQAEAENAKLRAQLDQMKGAEKTPPPKIDDFDDHDEYVAALSAHKAAELMDQRQVAALQREVEQRDERQKALQQQQMAEAQKNWASQVEEAKERYADFEEVVRAEDVQISPQMANVIAMSDVGADVAYHLGMNKQQAAQIAQMPVAEQVGAMRMLEQFIAVQTPKPRTQTQAPDPVTPVTPKATGHKDPSQMTAAEYRAWREAGGSF